MPVLFVEIPRFERGLSEPKSLVLPLHHTSISYSLPLCGTSSRKDITIFSFRQNFRQTGNSGATSDTSDTSIAAQASQRRQYPDGTASCTPPQVLRCSAFRVIHQQHASQHRHRRQDLGPAQGVHSDADAYGNGDNRLQV